MSTFTNKKDKRCKHIWDPVPWDLIPDDGPIGLTQCRRCKKILYDKDLYIRVNERYYGNL